MKVIFALFLVLMLTMAALQADAERQLSDKSMGRKASAGGSDATVSTEADFTATDFDKKHFSSKTTGSLSTTSASTPTVAAACSNTDAETKPQQHEKNDGYGNFSSAPAGNDPDGSHHVIEEGP